MLLKVVIVTLPWRLRALRADETVKQRIAARDNHRLSVAVNRQSRDRTEHSPLDRDVVAAAGQKRERKRNQKQGGGADGGGGCGHISATGSVVSLLQQLSSQA